MNGTIATMPHRPKKHFGQNFLIDHAIIQRIIEQIPPSEIALPWVEIGPGKGDLTRALIEREDCRKPLHAVEIDQDLIPLLRHTFGQNCHVHPVSILDYDWRMWREQRIRVIGNLPYHLSSPILFALVHLLLHEPRVQLVSAHFLLQKEVVDRIVASAGNTTYGRLSVMIQHYFSVHSPFDVPATAFYPIPQVTSSWLNLIPRTDPEAQTSHPQLFGQVVRAAFSQRRKTLKNALSHAGYTINWEALPPPISPQLRAENLSVADFVTLTSHIATQ